MSEIPTCIGTAPPLLDTAEDPGDEVEGAEEEGLDLAEDARQHVQALRPEKIEKVTKTAAKYVSDC